MKYLLIIAVVLTLAGCGTVRKVETGANTVGERLTMHLDGPWNHIDFPGIRPGQVWTMEGVTVDELIMYSGIKDGQVMHPENTHQSKKQDIVFRSNMATEQVVSLFEGILTRDDSLFKLMRVEPSTFGGKKGFLFEFERIRKIDNLRQLGFCYGAIDSGELFALVYVAPALTFFPRHQARVEAIAHSAFIKPSAGASPVTGSLPPPTKLAIRAQTRGLTDVAAASALMAPAGNAPAASTTAVPATSATAATVQSSPAVTSSAATATQVATPANKESQEFELKRVTKGDQ